MSVIGSKQPENFQEDKFKAFNKSKAHILLIAVCYFIANFFLLTINGLYWDDWVWTGNPFKEFFKYSQMLFGFSFPGFFIGIAYTLPPILTRSIVFLCFLTIGIILFKILTYERWELRNASTATLIFLLAPTYNSKYVLGTSHYAMCFCVFAVGCSLLFRSIIEDRKLFRYMSVPLFFVSFALNSLLVFYIVPIGYSVLLWWRLRSKGQTIHVTRVLLDYARIHVVQLSLPFVFFGYKLYSMATNPVYFNGVYSHSKYNHIQKDLILSSPGKAWTWLAQSINNLLDLVIAFISENTMVLLGFSAVAIAFCIMTESRKIKPTSLNPVTIFIIGFLSFYFGVFPYIAVGHSYSFNPFSSRHGILSSFGLTLLITSILILLERDLWKGVIISHLIKAVIVAAFIFQNIELGKIFYIDYMKQLSIISAMSENSDIKNNRTFLFRDGAKKYDANRVYDFYDFGGLFFAAFGDEKRLAAYDDSNGLKNLELFFSLRNDLPYKIKDAETYVPSHVITVTAGDADTSLSGILSIVYSSIFAKERYLQEIRRFVSVQVNPI